MTIAAVDDTHDPAIESWVESANDPATDFPLQNLPFGVFRRSATTRAENLPRVGVAIGDSVLDLPGAARDGLLDEVPAGVLQAANSQSVNALMACRAEERGQLRRGVSRLLRAGEASVRRAAEPHLLRASEVEMLLPAAIGNYTDFYASIFHATNVGRLFRPDNPLLPNYKFVPIGYHGRASSIVGSGASVVRPLGQTRQEGANVPRFGPSRRLDYEVEVGLFIGPGNALGRRIPVERAEEHAFGLCLVNDWSARDIQQWEYQPLGPFLAKNFATTVSRWVVTMEALSPFRSPAFARPDGDPQPLEYLDAPEVRASGAVDVALEVRLSSSAMREQGIEPLRVGRSNSASLYWTFSQMVAHHASNGCNLRPGDLLASGTVSGPGPDERGCLLEATTGGKFPIKLPSGERRTFLEDGDEVTVTGRCERPDFRSIGFGECRGRIVSAVQ